MRNLVICGLVMLGLLFAAPAARAGLIYSEDFNGVLGSQPAGWAPFTSGAGIVSRNDGASAYEQRRTGTDTTTIASYAQPDDSDRGIWRDTTTTAILRFSGGAGNRNGLVVRSRGIASHTTGDFYHARIEGNTLRLFRVRNGAFSSIAFDSTGDAITGTPNRLMKVRVDNIPVPETDNVRLRVDLYKGATEASGLLRSIDYTDISTLAITRAGGVGFRSYITTNGVRSVFNTLRVSNNNRFLLWYDDYYDGDGLRDEAFVSGMAHAISVRKSQFTGISTGDRGMALLDWDAETSTAPWRDVEVTTLMRLQTSNNGGTLGAGLVLRETGATTANDGDYYNYRLVRDEGAGSYSAELWRANSGSFALLDSVALTSAQVPESANIFLKFTSFGPLLTGMASLNADFSSPFGLVSALDSGAGAILTPGSVGYRVYGGAGITSGIVNFDNLTVTEVIPEPASLTLLAFGGVGLLARRRRRK